MSKSFLRSKPLLMVLVFLTSLPGYCRNINEIAHFSLEVELLEPLPTSPEASSNEFHAEVLGFIPRPGIRYVCVRQGDFGNHTHFSVNKLYYKMVRMGDRLLPAMSSFTLELSSSLDLPTSNNQLAIHCGMEMNGDLTILSGVLQVPTIEELQAAIATRFKLKLRPASVDAPIAVVVENFAFAPVPVAYLDIIGLFRECAQIVDQRLMSLDAIAIEAWGKELKASPPEIDLSCKHDAILADNHFIDLLALARQAKRQQELREIGENRWKYTQRNYEERFLNALAEILLNNVDNPENYLVSDEAGRVGLLSNLSPKQRMAIIARMQEIRWAPRGAVGGGLDGGGGDVYGNLGVGGPNGFGPGISHLNAVAQGQVGGMKTLSNGYTIMGKGMIHPGAVGSFGKK